MRALGRGLVLVVSTLLPAGPAAAESDVVARALVREDALPRGVPLEERIAEIHRRIQAAVVYPPLARMRAVEGTSEVAFEIAPEGEARHLEVVRSSGSALLDRAAERAVVDAAPLPPVLGRLRVPVRFRMEAREHGP